MNPGTMSRPESEFPESSRLEALLRESLLRRAKEIAHTIEERVRKLTQPQGDYPSQRQTSRWPQKQRSN